MLLLDQIIEAGTANVPPPLTTVLRQCIVLASQLKTPLLRTWAEQELNGYPSQENVPEYRIVPAGAYGAFQGMFGSGYNGRPIPAALLEPKHRYAAEVVHLTQPVSAYEALGDTQGALTYYWHADMIAYYQTSPSTVHAPDGVARSSQDCNRGVVGHGPHSHPDDGD